MDLNTTYLGLNLRTPLVPSASPLSEKLDNLKRMEDAGASAVVLHSLFEEQIRTERTEAKTDVLVCSIYRLFSPARAGGNDRCGEQDGHPARRGAA